MSHITEMRNHRCLAHHTTRPVPYVIMYLCKRGGGEKILQNRLHDVLELDHFTNTTVLKAITMDTGAGSKHKNNNASRSATTPSSSFWSQSRHVCSHKVGDSKNHTFPGTTHLHAPWLGTWPSYVTKSMEPSPMGAHQSMRLNDTMYRGGGHKLELTEFKRKLQR
jgi:hypothetical protein